MHPKFEKTRPIYLQIMEAIKLPALRGELEPAAPLKSVREMAREMGVNPNTMARAFKELEAEGFIYTLLGTGSFITQDKKRINAERKKMVDRLASEFVADIFTLGLSQKEIRALLNEMKTRMPELATSFEVSRVEDD